MGKSLFSENGSDQILMDGVTVGVQQCNGDGLNAFLTARLCNQTNGSRIQGLEHLSCGLESLIQFPDLIIKRFGFAYLKRK